MPFAASTVQCLPASFLHLLDKKPIWSSPLAFTSVVYSLPEGVGLDGDNFITLGFWPFFWGTLEGLVESDSLQTLFFINGHPKMSAMWKKALKWWSLKVMREVCDTQTQEWPPNCQGIAARTIIANVQYKDDSRVFFYTYIFYFLYLSSINTRVQIGVFSSVRCFNQP